MKVTLLAAERALSAKQLRKIATRLRAAGGPDLQLEVFSWGPVEHCPEVGPIRVVGPEHTYRAPVTSQTDSRGVDEGDPIEAETAPWGADDEPLPASDEHPEPAPTGPSGSVRLPRSPREGLALARRAAGRAHWGTRRALIRARRSDRYRTIRRWVVGSIPRQFAARVVSHPDLAPAITGSAVVFALNERAVQAAWRVARRVPGPAVVQGIAAAEREVRRRSTLQTQP